MTPARALITWLTSSGVTLRLDGDAIVHRGPRRILSPDVLAKLRQHKVEAIAELRRLAQADPPCPAEVAERAAIVAEGDHCDRATADARALAEYGLPSLSALANAHRERILTRLHALLPASNDDGRRLLRFTRVFLETDHWQAAIALGWNLVELFGIAPDAPKTPPGTWGLVATQVFLLRGSRIETITEDQAIFRTRAGAQWIWPRFRSEINECVLWWECTRFLQSNVR